MGCCQSTGVSKQTQEVVNNCTERTASMKKSMTAHRSFATAHFTYATALKKTGAALSDYAQGVVQLPHHRSSQSLLAPETSMGGVVIRSGGGSTREEPTLSSMKENIQNMSLLQVITEIDYAFVKASESAELVSKIIESDGLHSQSSSAHNPGDTNHSMIKIARLFNRNMSCKGQQVASSEYDYAPEKTQTHAMIIRKILAWEKRLCDEVKACEDIQLLYKKKIASLNKLEKRGGRNDSLARTKEMVNQLHTRCNVHMQCVERTVSKINGLRDEELYPILIQLTEKMDVMWKEMGKQHGNQSQLLQAFRAISISQSPKETSDQTYSRSQQLYVHMKRWCSKLQNLILLQKEYIESLNNWVKLNVKPIDCNLDQVSSLPPKNPQNPKILSFLGTWQDQLEKLPQERVKTAITTFAAAIDTMIQDQSNELRLKASCIKTRIEIDKTAQKFCARPMARRTTKNESEFWDNELEVIAEEKKVMEALYQRLKTEEEEYSWYCVQMNGKSLENLHTGLPEIVAAMSEFTRACSDMYGKLKSHSTSSNGSS